MHFTRLATALGLASATVAQVQKGFNYGATFENGACRWRDDFSYLFNTARNLPGASGFTSARLYTMIQCGTVNDPISAIQAAIDTDTTLLLGLWASAGPDVFGNEKAALSRAIGQYGTAFTDRVVGISVGSEDLYRSSPQGVANNAGLGADAATIESYIWQIKDLVKGTPLEGKPIGHVDTWTAWVRPENANVAAAVDFLGHNSFPYFESTLPNPIENAAQLFWNAFGGTESVAGGKPVWITETGWPTGKSISHISTSCPCIHRTNIFLAGPQSNSAVASPENARTYWSQVGCGLFDDRNTWWYTLADSNTAQTDIAFATYAFGNGQPAFDLNC